MESTNCSQTVAGKPKKKKRSFLDDDFFNMRKSKVKSLARASLDTMNGAPVVVQAKEEAVISSTTPVIPVSTRTKYDSGDNHFSSDDNNCSFESAKDSFQSPNKIESITVVEKPSNGRNMMTSGGDTAVNIVDILGDVDFRIKGGNKGFAANFANLYTPPTDDIQSDTVVAYGQSVEEEDFVDSDLREFFSGIVTKTTTGNEEDRIYQIKVSSRMGVPFEYEKKITGETTFANLVEQLSQTYLRDNSHARCWERGVLVWIEGRSELKPMFKPSTLRIPRPSADIATKMNCLFIPLENVSNFEELYEEFKEVPEHCEDDVGEVYMRVQDDSDICVLTVESEDEGGSSGGEETAQKSEYFIIGLKGRDNKRIEAEVGPSTKIRNILKHYMEVKGIPETPGILGKLIFDDEELDLNATVADTELEEDFEVQVYI